MKIFNDDKRYDARAFLIGVGLLILIAILVYLGVNV